MRVDYTIPYWHPIAIHFPIAFLLASSVASVVWLVRPDVFWGRLALVMSVLGSIGAIAAFKTGEAIRWAREGAPIIEELVARHELLAKWTVAFGLVSVAWLAVILWRARANERVGIGGRIGAALACGAAAGIVAWGSHLGGLMTWGVPG